MQKIFLVIYNIKNKRRFFKYFETEFEKDEFKRKIKYVPTLFVVEDSTDIYFTD